LILIQDQKLSLRVVALCYSESRHLDVYIFFEGNNIFFPIGPQLLFLWLRVGIQTPGYIQQKSLTSNCKQYKAFHSERYISVTFKNLLNVFKFDVFILHKTYHFKVQSPVASKKI